MNIRKVDKINKFFFIMICVFLFNVSFSVNISNVSGEVLPEVVIEDTLFEGDLELSGNETLTVMDCVFNVTGTTILRDHARLILMNATFYTLGFELYDMSVLRMESSNYSWGIMAHGYSLVSIMGTDLPPIYGKQIIELNEASSLLISDSMSLQLFIFVNDQADVNLMRSGPDITFQMGDGAGFLEIHDSFVKRINVFWDSYVHVTDSTIDEVFVAHRGTFVAESCFISTGVGYYDHNSQIFLNDCWINSLIDGVIYDDMDLTLSGDNIMAGNYSTGVELNNCTVIDTKYILYLLGENGQYRLRELTSDVIRVLIESSNVTAESINSDEFVFFIGRNGILLIQDSTFNRVIASTTMALILDNCDLSGIFFNDELIDFLRIFDSRVISLVGPAISGGWATNVLIVNSVIKSVDVSEPPDVIIAYINEMTLRYTEGFEFEGQMGVKFRLYNTDVVFSNIEIENLHNDHNSSSLLFTNGATYSLYTSQPAKLVIDELEVTPKRGKPGETITVQAKISNEGELLGTDTFTLYIDEEITEQITITLAPGDSKSISIDLNNTQVGRHNIQLNNVETSFIVSNLSFFEEFLYRYGFIGFGIIIVVVILYIRLYRSR